MRALWWGEADVEMLETLTACEGVVGRERGRSMSLDLANLLRDWPYEPGQITVRVIEGDDGEPKVQMRLDLGLIQMEVSGRPDGQRPHGYESFLDYYEAMLEEYEPTDEEDQFVLTGEDCRLLREEAVQYYHRYVSLMILGDYMGVFRDTTRNMRVLDLCRDYAEGEDDQTVLEQFRAYLLMMQSRALASQSIADNEANGALFALDHGLEGIRVVMQEQGRSEEEYEGSSEVQVMRGMRNELIRKLPASQRTELAQRLEDAIAAENYELAAILRDELKNLKDHA